MYFVILIFSIIYLSILGYILKNKDTKLALYYVGVMLVVALVKLSHMLYFKIKGLTMCEVTKKIICNEAESSKNHSR